MSKIIELRAANVKRLTAVRIRPDGNLVIIGGMNGAGKTSVLDSIAIALGGPRETPEDAVRAGQERAEIILELDDLTVRRVVRASGEQTVVVSNREGMKASSPQTMLDKLAGKLSFDPVALLRLDPKAQRDRLVELLGLDFSEVDQDRARLFDERTECTRRVRALEQTLAAQPVFEGVPAEPVSAEEIKAQVDAATAQAAARSAKERALAKCEADATAAAQGITRAAQQLQASEKTINEWIQEFDRKLAELKADRDRAAANCTTAERRAQEFAAIRDVAKMELDQAPPPPDLETLTTKILVVQETNAKIEKNRARERLAAALVTEQKEHQEITKAIEHLDQKKADTLAAAPFPVPGLGFNDRGVTFNGFALGQASSAEQLRVSVAMGCAFNPKLRIMFVKDAAFLDASNLALLGALAEEKDFQIWIERVGTGDATAIVIEDGHVRGQDQEGPAHG